MLNTWLKRSISPEISSPVSSGNSECHRGLWAMKSPKLIQSSNSGSLLNEFFYPASQPDESGYYLLLLPPALSSMACNSRCLTEFLSLISWNRNVSLMIRACPSTIASFFTPMMRLLSRKALRAAQRLNAISVFNFLSNFEDKTVNGQIEKLSEDMSVE